MPIPTVPTINIGPELDVNEQIRWASAREIFPLSKSSLVSFAPRGYPAKMLIRKIYAESDGQLYNFFTGFEKTFETSVGNPVAVRSFEKIIKGKSAGRTHVAQTLIPLRANDEYFSGFKTIAIMIVKSKIAQINFKLSVLHIIFVNCLVFFSSLFDNFILFI